MNSLRTAFTLSRRRATGALGILATVLWLTATTTGQNRSDLEVQLKAAMNKELVDGDLEGAIEIYKQIAATPNAPRPVAAKALLQIGLCYEKLGKGEAQKAYQQVLSNYADQTEIASQARTRLTELAKSAGSTQPSAIALRQVWADGTPLIAMGDITPDHRYLTFVDFLTGDLAVRDLVNGTSRHLTKKGSWDVSDEFAEYSVISADGTQVAHNWLNRPEGKKPGYAMYQEGIWDLRVLGLEGSGSRVLRQWERGTYVRPFGWSPDGKRVLVGLNGAAEGSGAFRLVFVSATDGSVEEVTTAPIPTGYGGPRDTRISYRLSPDGRYILYARPPEKDASQKDIFLLSVRDGQESLLIQHPANDHAPLWTPDGKRVVFASNRTGALAIWTVEVVEGKAQGSPLLVKANIGTLIRAIGLAKDGSLYYALAAQPQDVYVTDIDPATGKLSGQPKAIGGIVGSNRAPSWSPDGQSLAYHGQGGGTNRIVVRSAKSGQEREIPTKLLLENFAPVRWFPDGQSLLVSAFRDKAESAVDYHRIDLGTGEPTLLRRGTVYTSRKPYVSSDGKTVYFTERKAGKAEPTRLIAYEIETGSEKDIHQVATDTVLTLAVSPDGRQVAFVEADAAAGVGFVKVMALGGGQPRELYKAVRPERLSTSFPVEWTPGGGHVLVARTLDARGFPRLEVLRVPVDGGAAQPIGLARGGIWRVSVHPDGRQIAFDAQENRFEVWVMENFLPSLTAAR